MAYLQNGVTVLNDSRIFNNIAGTNSATVTALALELVTENTIAAGTTMRVSSALFEYTQSNNTYVQIFGPINFAQRGSITLAVDLKVNDSLGPGEFRAIRYRNGTSSTVWSQLFSNTTYAEYTSNQNILPGDQFSFQLRGGAYVSGKSTILTIASAKYIEIRTSASSAWIPIGSNSWYHNYV